MSDKPQLDHDGDGKPGGAKRAGGRHPVPSPAIGSEWIVTRGGGLIQVPADQVAHRLGRDARLPTPRDFAVAGIDPS